MVSPIFCGREENVNFTAGVYQLTQEFMADYPEASYPELMHKLGRPYSCLLVDTHKEYYICIPFRSHINHKNAFMFHGTERSMHPRQFARKYQYSTLPYFHDVMHI